MFEVGDKVRIKKDISTEHFNVIEKMLDYAGREAKIKYVGSNFCLLNINDYVWNYELLEKVEVELKHQEVKADYGKLQMMLMLPAINRSVVRVREYGILKYKDRGNLMYYYKTDWKKVERCRWENALIRHLMEYIKDPYSKDEESGLRHIDHIACNLAYILENMEGEGNDK